MIVQVEADDRQVELGQFSVAIKNCACMSRWMKGQPVE